MPHPMKPVLWPQGPSEAFCFPLFGQNRCKSRLWPAAAQKPSLVWPFGPRGTDLGTLPFAVGELRAPEVAKWSTLAYRSSKAVIHVAFRLSMDLFWQVPIPMAHFICGYLWRGDKQVKQWRKSVHRLLGNLSPNLAKIPFCQDCKAEIEETTRVRA